MSMNDHMSLERGEIYESGDWLDDDLVVVDHLGGTRKVDIYRCRSKSLKKHVAVKILRPEFCIHFRSLRDVMKEGAMLARMNHPNVMHGYSFELEPAPRIVMDYVGGQDLKSAFFTGNYDAFPIAEAIALVRDLADGLEHVHEQGVLHLDVKPSNVLYSPEGAVLIDFSVATEFDPDDLPKDNAGTRGWMAPEQTAREKVGPYSDVFGLGVVLYQLLSKGELPFSTHEVDDSTTEDGERVVNKVKIPNYDESPTHPSDVNPLVSRELGDVALKAISPSIEDRYSTPAELAEALTGLG